MKTYLEKGEKPRSNRGRIDVIPDYDFLFTEKENKKGKKKNIDDNDVPLSKADSDDSNKKTTTTIDDNDVPLSDAAPETGDHVNPAMLIAGMAVSYMSVLIAATSLEALFADSADSWADCADIAELLTASTASSLMAEMASWIEPLTSLPYLASRIFLK